KKFADQGGTLKGRDRFTGGGTKAKDRLHGALKAIDPATGEIKVSERLDYPNFGGVLATAGNLIFAGHVDRTFAAYDAKTLKEVWSVNLGTGMNAPPVTYSVNGKQYVAILVGSKQANAVFPFAPELKLTSTASMLFVFGL